MPFTFRSLALLASAICFGLAAVWLLAPNLLLGIWGVEYSYSVGLVARRAGALFLGIGAMLVLARNSEPSQSRMALTSGFFVACLTLAALGIFEFLSGHAGVGILSAVVVEVALAVAFLLCIRKDGALLRARA